MTLFPLAAAVSLQWRGWTIGAVLVVASLCFLLPWGLEKFQRPQFHAVNVSLVWGMIKDVLDILLAEGKWFEILSMTARCDTLHHTCVDYDL